MAIKTITIVALSIVFSPSFKTTESVKKPAEEIPLSSEVDNYVCNYLYIFEGYDCDTAVKPKVYLLDWGDATLYGRYWYGTTHLELNRRLKPEYINVVMLHELVHYYGYVAGTDWGRDTCKTEEVARRVTAMYEGVPYSDDWRQWYNC